MVMVIVVPVMAGIYVRDAGDLVPVVDSDRIALQRTRDR